MHPLLDRIERETERLSELVGLVLTMARLDNSADLERGDDIALERIDNEED